MYLNSGFLKVLVYNQSIMSSLFIHLNNIKTELFIANHHLDGQTIYVHG